MSKPWTHLIEVEMSVKWEQMPETAELKMPVWTPGSYLIREYSRHVQDFAVKNGAGAELTWRKTNKNTWRVNTNGARNRATYRVYANELSVRTSELNYDHGFWNNAASLMFPMTGSPRAPLSSNPSDWKVATGLPLVDGQTNTFRAPNFDILYDSPFEVSNFKQVSFVVEGKAFWIIFSGDGNYDQKQTASDVKKIVEQPDYDNRRITLPRLHLYTTPASRRRAGTPEFNRHYITDGSTLSPGRTIRAFTDWSPTNSFTVAT